MINMNWIKNIIQKFGCDHEHEFVCNIYGDEINQLGGRRSCWKYTKCKNIQHREDLCKPYRLYDELNKLYDEYYKDKYKKWCSEHSEILYSLTMQLREAACSGYDYLIFLLDINTDTYDRDYYKKWLDSNGLNCSFELITKGDVKIKQYRCIIEWKKINHIK